MDCSDTERRLDVYLDQELAAEESSKLERHLGACSACAARVDGERKIRARIARLLASEAAPAPLRARIAQHIERPAPVVRRIGPGHAWRYGFALAAAVAAVVLVWRLAPRPGGDAGLAEGLAADHTFMHGPSGTEDLILASDRGELTRWFEGRLQHAPPLPDAGGDVELVGGQVCPVRGRHVAHAVYRLRGTLASFFYVPDAAITAETRGGRIEDVNYLTWKSGRGQAYVMSTAPPSDLDRLRASAPDLAAASTSRLALAAAGSRLRRG